MFSVGNLPSGYFVPWFSPDNYTTMSSALIKPIRIIPANPDSHKCHWPDYIPDVQILPQTTNNSGSLADILNNSMNWTNSRTARLGPLLCPIFALLDRKPLSNWVPIYHMESGLILTGHDNQYKRMKRFELHMYRLVIIWYGIISNKYTKLYRNIGQLKRSLLKSLGSR